MLKSREFKKRSKEIILIYGEHEPYIKKYYEWSEIMHCPHSLYYNFKFQNSGDIVELLMRMINDAFTCYRLQNSFKQSINKSLYNKLYGLLIKLIYIKDCVIIIRKKLSLGFYMLH